MVFQIRVIDGATFKTKHAQLQQRIDTLRAQTDKADKRNAGRGETAANTFELSQSLRQRWVTADIPGRRRLLDIVCLNWRLDGASLVATMRKPFDVVAEGLISEEGRGNWTAFELFVRGVDAWGDDVKRLVIAA